MEFIEVSAFKYSPKEYQFYFDRIDSDSQDKFWDAVEYLDTDNHFVAIQWLEELVSKFPEFIDAWMHLGLAYKSIKDDSRSLSCIVTAYSLGRMSLPAKFDQKRHRLLWVQHENRPFLRACHALGLAYQELEWFKDAVALYQFILDVNPNDNQGVRELITECYLGLGEYSKLIDFYDIHDEWATTGMSISYALALIAIGKTDEAKEHISMSWNYYHLIWKELLKKRHRKPITPSGLKGYVSANGADMAYEYWTRCGKYWNQVDGALAILSDLSLHQPKVRTKP